MIILNVLNKVRLQRNMKETFTLDRFVFALSFYSHSINERISNWDETLEGSTETSKGFGQTILGQTFHIQ